MRNTIACSLLATALLTATLSVPPRLLAQGKGDSQEAQIAANNALEKELESVAIIDRKVMIPMSDGKLMAADIYRPKDESKKYGTIFVRTPYNFNYWDVALGAPRSMGAELNAVKRGYAYVEINERGQFFSQVDQILEQAGS